MDYIYFLELAQRSIQNRIYVGEGSFKIYKEYVESFMKQHSDVVEQYGLTESELFVMFMMLTKNYDEIQQCASSCNGTQFDKECVLLFDSFLSKIPRSTQFIFYRVDKYQRIENFKNMSTYNCSHYLTVSTNCPDYNCHQNDVKFVIHRRLIGKTKAHEVFKICNVNNEFQVSFERNTWFRVDSVDRKGKIVELSEI